MGASLGSRFIQCVIYTVFQRLGKQLHVTGVLGRTWDFLTSDLESVCLRPQEARLACFSECPQISLFII